jgi:hypothetical protein
VAASEQLTKRLVEVVTKGEGGRVLGLASFEQYLHAAISRNVDQLASVGATVPLETAPALVHLADLAQAALAEHADHVVLEVDAVQAHADELGAARTGVDQQHDQRGVAAGLEVLASADGQEPLELRLTDHGHRLVRHGRRLELAHRMRDLFLVLQPPVEGMQAAVAGLCRPSKSTMNPSTSSPLASARPRLPLARRWARR